MPLQTIAWPVLWIVLANAMPVAVADARDHPGERAGDMLEGVVVVVADDHAPAARIRIPGPAVRGRSIVSVVMVSLPRARI